ncbi:NDR1/HIN1-like protein 13 [Abrus precatorius]|uniref:NDR1/HIN1-like protein 13 n=1 Tax=Abrus precatorius TaxID=3816 RepID=A0A8B8KRK7_ABRPR|nr:NDR1/HIN1-like protein 13 [Abrus precatorius]
MNDRVYPKDSPPLYGEFKTMPSHEATVSSNPSAPTGTYVVQIPKNQVYRLPPPENARLYEEYTRRKNRPFRCCCCLCWFISIVFALVVLIGIAAGVLYLIFRPKAPDYAIESVAVKGMNLTSPSFSAAISPEFDVAVRADNGNAKIGIYYEEGSSVEMFYNDVRLCDGALPVFYQPSNNVTVFDTVLKGDGIELTASDRVALVNAVIEQSVPFTLKLRAPVRIKLGIVKMWKINVKVDCDVTVDQLTARARIVKKDCSYGVDLWG